MHIFVHTNDVQALGAKIAAFSFSRALPQSSPVGVSVLSTETSAELMHFHGSFYLYKGRKVTFDIGDIQSFTLLRLAIPEVMQYEAKSLVVDPDVFWVSNESPCQLFDYVDAEKPIACVHDQHWRTSVMVTNNHELRSWSMLNTITALKEGADYKQLIELMHVDQSKINLLPPCFNCFDHLPADGKVLHFTRRQTQPWRTGLPLREKYGENFGTRTIKALLGKNKHLAHPDPKLESLFFKIAREALDAGYITKEEILQAQSAGLVRQDFLRLLTP
ncbi:hypothetical protein N9Z25_06750 [Luminiphilus sp.]|nr:hypothetical protein [Luminiphilus sp.]